MSSAGVKIAKDGKAPIVGVFVLLFAFWMILTGSLHPENIIGGVLASGLVVFLSKDLLLRKVERPAITSSTLVQGVIYIVNLVVAIIIANIDIAIRVLSPSMPISPGVIKFNSAVEKDMTRVLFANSITLTPGTLTLDVGDGNFVVHGLTRDHAEKVTHWAMEKRLLDIERAGS